MSTAIRPEISQKNPYWIPKHRYYELMKKINTLKILSVVSSILGLVLPLLDQYLDEQKTREIAREEAQKVLAESNEEESE